VAFTMDGRGYAAIKQNPEKPNRWGELARSGQQVIQLKDVQANRFVGVAVGGEVKEYLGLRTRGEQTRVDLGISSAVLSRPSDHQHRRVLTVSMNAIGL
jgi:hypothetical protein